MARRKLTDEEREARREARRSWARAKLRWVLAGLAEEFGELAVAGLVELVKDLADDGKVNGSASSSSTDEGTATASSGA